MAQRNVPHPPSVEGGPPPQVIPSLFDLFYEEFLTELMKNPQLAEETPDAFMRLQTDIERVEFIINLRPFVQQFEITNKVSIRQ